MIRQNARGDDRLIRAIRIISQVTMMVRVMHELKLHSHICGRDNVGGMSIGKGSATFSAAYVDQLLVPDPCFFADRHSDRVVSEGRPSQEGSRTCG
jgi:hypothetical protein